MTSLAPIVLFVYKRLWHTMQTIEALERNYLASESELFIFSDGPKDKESEKQVEEVRKYIRSVKGFKSVYIIEREKNWGLANNIIDGVTKIVNQYGKVIVLEDDIVTSPFFLRFMNEALAFYQEKEKVMHISGYTLPICKEGLPDVFFMKQMSCWGWATWKRAWNYYKKDIDFYLKVFNNRRMIYDFNLEGSYDYFKQIILNKKGIINTWAVFWYASIYLNNGLCLYPRDSFVLNIGHDGSGEHCGRDCRFNVELIKNYNIKFDDNVQESELARRYHVEYFKSLKRPLLIRAVNKIKRIITQTFAKR